MIPRPAAACAPCSRRSRKQGKCVSQQPRRRPDDFSGDIRVLDPGDEIDTSDQEAENGADSNPEQGTETGADSARPLESGAEQGDVEGENAAEERNMENVGGNARKTKAVVIDVKSGAGPAFIKWVKAGVKSRQLKINKADAMVHVLPEGVALVTPAIFKAFLRHIGEDDSDAAHRKLQKKVAKLGLNIKNSRNMDIHQIEIENSSTKLQAYLFPTETFFGSRKPDVNAVLKLVQK